jgi:hypothetical protein
MWKMLGGLKETCVEGRPRGQSAVRRAGLLAYLILLGYIDKAMRFIVEGWSTSVVGVPPTLLMLLEPGVVVIHSEVSGDH